jgi:hypothetical protein
MERQFQAAIFDSLLCSLQGGGCLGVSLFDITTWSTVPEMLTLFVSRLGFGPCLPTKLLGGFSNTGRACSGLRIGRQSALWRRLRRGLRRESNPTAKFVDPSGDIYSVKTTSSM